jgi:chemotaxis signal transduction protein
VNEETQFGAAPAPEPAPSAEPTEAVVAEGEDQVLAVEPELPTRQYCVFRAGRERFSLMVLDVEEVVEWPKLTRVPLSPAFLMGIFNLRGSIVPVIDIAFTEVRRSDLPPKHVVVACIAAHGEQDEVRLGIAADEVLGTFNTTEPLLVDEAPTDVPQCNGMLRHEDRLALNIDLKRLVHVFPVGQI